MKVDIKKLSEVEYQVSGSFSFDDIKDIYTEELERVRREVKIPGFRPGKAPHEIVEARYGEEVKSSAVRKKIGEIVDEETKKKDRWIGITGSYDLVWNEKDGQITFSIKVEVIPRKKIDLDVKLDRKKEDEDKLKVSDDEIKREIELARERYATLENSDKEEIGEGDIGVFDILVKDIRTGRAVSREKDRIVDMSRVEDWFKNIALGMKKGETKEAVVYLNGDKKVRVALKEIKKKVLPSEEDLAKTLGFESVEKLREDIKKRIKEGKKKVLRDSKYFEYVVRVAEKNKIQPPRNLIARKFEDIRRRDPNLSEQDAQNLAVIQAAETVILMNVAEDEKIEVKDEDIEQFMSKLASDFRVSPERLREAVKDAQDEIVETIKQEKAREKIMERIPV